MEIFTVFNMDYQNLRRPQWWTSLLPTGDLPPVEVMPNLCWMLMIETTMMLANLVADIFSRYLDVSDDESDGVNPEDELRTVLSMLNDASLPEFDFCKKEKVSVNPSTCN